jgi:hypothetical protein
MSRNTALVAVLGASALAVSAGSYQPATPVVGGGVG